MCILTVSKSEMNSLLNVRSRLNKKEAKERLLYLTWILIRGKSKKILKNRPSEEELRNSSEFKEVSRIWTSENLELFINSKDELVRMRKMCIPQQEKIDPYDEPVFSMNTNNSLGELISWFQEIRPIA